mgnify:CR=1 FL=1
MKKIGICLFLFLSLGLTSCGFKLKGQYYLPESLKTLHLSSEKKFSPLAKQVKLRLSQNQIRLVNKSEPDVAELYILPEQFQRRTLSLFPNGQVAEYELIYQVRYRVRKPGEESVSFEFELSREFRDDPNNALAKERERQLILNELRVMASDRILAQLTSLQ